MSLVDNIPIISVSKLPDQQSKDLIATEELLHRGIEFQFWYRLVVVFDHLVVLVLRAGQIGEQFETVPLRQLPVPPPKIVGQVQARGRCLLGDHLLLWGLTTKLLHTGADVDLVEDLLEDARQMPEQLA